jgi:hypothetical protein
MLVGTVLGLLVCAAVLAKSVSGASQSRSYQNMAGFVGNTVLSAVVLAVAASLLLAPDVWRSIFDGLASGYFFVYHGGQR